MNCFSRGLNKRDFMNIVKAYLSMCYALQASLNLYTLHFSFFITIFNLSELQILI